MSRIVYTAGYGKMYPRDLAALAEALDLTVVDVRGRPTSRRAGFGGRQLAELLGKRYAWRGDSLGGVYHLANARDKWPSGVRALLAEIQRPLLLCQCHAPGGCHRHQLALEILRQAPRTSVVHLVDREAVDAREVERIVNLPSGADDSYDAIDWSSFTDLRRQAEA